MKLFKKIFVITVLLTLTTIAALYSYVKYALPDTGEPEILTIKATPERLERGKYLANSVTICMDCHSTRDWSKYAGPLKLGTLGMGGEAFTEDLGFPGNFYAPNITPAGIGKWTDGEILRAITTGVAKDGHPLFPLMPHPKYGKMDKEDIYSIITYIRSLTPITHKVKASEPSFPFSLILRTIPQKASFTPIPDRKNTVAYGGYLVNAAACANCHTPVDDKGQPLLGMDFAGGRAFPTPMGTITSANITQDQDSGIGFWSEETFINKFKAYSYNNYKAPGVKKGETQTVMPWMMYSQMKTEDLKAMYAYLKTLKPVNNNVITFEAPKN